MEIEFLNRVFIDISTEKFVGKLTNREIIKPFNKRYTRKSKLYNLKIIN